MRKAWLIGLLVACAIAETRGQSNIRTNLTPDLVLTMEVIDARFCESDYLRLRLRLRYFNSGDQSVILYRQSNTIVTYFISKNIDEAERENYEQKYSPMQSSVGPSDPVESERPNPERFVILKPAASYDTTTQADFPFIFDGKSKDASLLRPGSHVLQIRVRTWSEQQDVTISLRERWSGYGYLWTSSIVSRPMTFTIAKHPQLVGCSKKLEGE